MTTPGGLDWAGPGMLTDKKGYTLIELIVVVVIIGIVLTLTAPRLRYAWVNDPLKAVARRLVGTIHTLRNDAVREQQAYTLYIDSYSNTFWTVHTSMTDEEQALAREKAPALSGGVRIRDVWIKGKGTIAEGEARMVFTPRGYAPMSAIHLRAEDGREMTLELSPFMSRVTVLDKYVEFE